MGLGVTCISWRKGRWAWSGFSCQCWRISVLRSVAVAQASRSHRWILENKNKAKNTFIINRTRIRTFSSPEATTPGSRIVTSLLSNTRGTDLSQQHAVTAGTAWTERNSSGTVRNRLREHGQCSRRPAARPALHSRERLSWLGRTPTAL